MRVLVLTTVATLVASVATVSATSSIDTTNVSPMGSPDLAQPSDITQSLGTGNRRLRRNKDDDEEDITDVNDIDSANEEERTVTAKMLKQFEKWHARGDTVASVYRKYKIQSLLEDAYNLNKWDDLLANPKWQKYINYDEFVNKLNAAA